MVFEFAIFWVKHFFFWRSLFVFCLCPLWSLCFRGQDGGQEHVGTAQPAARPKDCIPCPHGLSWVLNRDGWWKRCEVWFIVIGRTCSHFKTLPFGRQHTRKWLHIHLLCLSLSLLTMSQLPEYEKKALDYSLNDSKIWSLLDRANYKSNSCLSPCSWVSGVWAGVSSFCREM